MIFLIKQTLTHLALNTVLSRRYWRKDNLTEHHTLDNSNLGTVTLALERL